MTPEVVSENFHILADAPHAIQKLREMILQLAVQGRLVPQDPKDEPASVLLKKIRAEKEKLIKEGRIKKQTPLPTVDSDEVQYALPDGWEWVRLGEVQVFTNGYAFRSSDYQESGVGIIRMGELGDDGGIDESNMKFVSRSFADSLSPVVRVKPGDLLMGMSGSIGKLAFNKSDKTYLLNQRVGRLEPILVDKRYLYCFLQTIEQLYLNISFGMAIKNLSTKQINHTPFPLPPLAEQKRIVAKVDQLMALCDELEAHQQKRAERCVTLNRTCLNVLTSPDEGTVEDAWRRISDNFGLLYGNPENVSALREAILQLAVQGSLVPQDPDDEPASVLLKRIRAEKEKLIKEGRIKKQKPLSPIRPDEVPYGLPDGWEWVRVDDVVLSISNGCARRQTKEPTQFPVTRIETISKGVVDRSRVRFLTDLSQNDMDKYILVKGDVLLSHINSGVHLGKTAIFDDDNPLYHGINLLRIRPAFPSTMSQFFHLCMNNLRFTGYFQSIAQHAIGQESINQTKLRSSIFPLPPLGEQKRIVAKVDQLMALSDELETKLKHSQSAAETLVGAVVSELTAA